MSTTSRAYETVLEYANRLHDVEQTDHLLRWDSDVMMPEGGAPARSRQRSTLSKLMYDLRSDDDLGAALDAVEQSELTEAQRAVSRCRRRTSRPHP